jgi:two-component system response regulator FlrC
LRIQLASTVAHLPPLLPADSPRLTLARSLVGHTVEEVERELILGSLAHYRGNRTLAAHVLGISVRTLRNKIKEYAAQGRAVPASGRAQTSASRGATISNRSAAASTDAV